jgi:hypothetical protein
MEEDERALMSNPALSSAAAIASENELDPALRRNGDIETGKIFLLSYKDILNLFLNLLSKGSVARAEATTTPTASVSTTTPTTTTMAKAASAVASQPGRRSAARSKGTRTRRREKAAAAAVAGTRAPQRRRTIKREGRQRA